MIYAVKNLKCYILASGYISEAQKTCVILRSDNVLIAFGVNYLCTGINAAPVGYLFEFHFFLL